MAMTQANFRKIAMLAEAPDAAEASVVYLREKMSSFLKQNERVLILFRKGERASCRILEQAIEACGAIPIWLGEDCRWMTMLKTAFKERSSCLVGSPLTILGLSKL